MELPSRTTVFAAVGTVALGVAAYAVYFDYRRRNDPEFRRQIKKEQKRLSSLEKERAKEAQLGDRQALLRAHKQSKVDPLPVSPEDREQAFMQEVAKGEQLYAGGEGFKYESAICFFRALKMYPQPAELTRIYEQTIPPVSHINPPLMTILEY